MRLLCLDLFLVIFRSLQVKSFSLYYITTTFINLQIIDDVIVRTNILVKTNIFHVLSEQDPYNWKANTLTHGAMYCVGSKKCICFHCIFTTLFPTLLWLLGSPQKYFNVKMPSFKKKLVSLIFFYNIVFSFQN